MHLVIETMRRAYCDRAKYLGNPDFTDIPSHLTSKEYARKLAARIDPHKASPSETIAPEIALAPESEETTHFSVVDKDGMAVANTYTLENSYGSRIVVRGAGFLLNNEMTDFNRISGHTDRKGLIGTPANQIAPGKRMLSSQTPAIVCRDGRPVLVTGSPGGRTIINTVLCIIVDMVDFGMDVRQAVDAPRLHHPSFPDQVGFEGFRPARIRGKHRPTEGNGPPVPIEGVETGRRTLDLDRSGNRPVPGSGGRPDSRARVRVLTASNGPSRVSLVESDGSNRSDGRAERQGTIMSQGIVHDMGHY